MRHIRVYSEIENDTGVEYALVYHPKFNQAKVDEEEELARRASDSSLTLFGRFIWRMRELHEIDSVTTAGGTANWSNAPIDQMVANGLYIVLMTTAKSLNLRMKTESKVQDVAGRVNRLIEVGLALEYETPEAAAEAFLKEVVRGTERGVRMGARPGMKISGKSWKTLQAGSAGRIVSEIRSQKAQASGTLSGFIQAPAALFFMNLLKSAIALRKERDALAEQIDEEIYSPFTNETVSILESRFGNLMYMQKDPDFITVSEYLSLQYKEVESSPAECLAAIPALEATMEKIQMLKKLPVFQNDFHEDDDGISTIRYAWLRTQLCLAAGDIPDRTRLSTTVWAEVRAGFRAKNSEQIVADFFQRMESRGMRMSSREREMLTAIVKDHFTNLVSEALDDLANVIGNDILIDVVLEEITFSPEEALDIALGWRKDGSVDLSHILAKTHEAFDSFVRTHVVENIPWRDVTPEQLMSMISANVLSDEMIIDGIFKIGQDDRATVVRMILEGDIGLLPPKAIVLMVHQGNLEITPDLLVRLFPHLPNRVIARCARLYMNELSVGHKPAIPDGLLVRCLSVLPRDCKRWRTRTRSRR